MRFCRVQHRCLLALSFHTAARQQVASDAPSVPLAPGFRATKAFNGVGRTIRDAGLWGIEALVLIALDRADGTHIVDVGPDTAIEVRWPCMWMAREAAQPLAGLQYTVQTRMGMSV